MRIGQEREVLCQLATSPTAELRLNFRKREYSHALHCNGHIEFDADLNMLYACSVSCFLPSVLKQTK